MADTNTPTPAEKEAIPVAEVQPPKPEEVKNELPTQAEEEESDWEELDDVLDDFSATKTTSQAAQDKIIPESQEKQEKSNSELSAADQDALLKQLEAGMAELMGALPTDASGQQTKEGDSSKEKTNDIPGMPQSPGNEDWNALTEELEKKGFTMTDVMKLMMGEELMTGGEGVTGMDGSTTTDKASGTAKQPSPSTKKGEDNFQETIQRTMERMQESGDKATAEVNESGNEDVLMQILKAMESSGLAGAGEGDDGNLDKLFMGIMEQLSNKEMLYEPLKELDDKFGPWLRENKEKIGKEDRERYELQASLVSDIVRKFEEKNFSDDKPEDRAYIWEKMQKMQAAGSPPDDLISAPFMDESKLQALGQEGCAQQ
ncbi:peroxisomal membrane protein receptor Pex19, putative [Trichophyton verrucosum HKI 0517]|uniref:Peroxisomal membrane protein receptor Pex19, putative n=1 Tax=Trichophyton verrucosum (strain HKI 0517) TaxID=663202 RepID=D4DK92_TRIVH|nr:peroxisomal membrane protein receptor Pex19, putative [Trichophyton verrucosum HKI 0517]EFE37732.1 peroxisomal membrane protein receptor Pex19, putative [Trichophyton verrucosum HKI 0517]